MSDTTGRCREPCCSPLPAPSLGSMRIQTRSGRAEATVLLAQGGLSGTGLELSRKHVPEVLVAIGPVLSPLIRCFARGGQFSTVSLQVR